MKNLYKSKLQLNKGINILRYIVFIMAFMFVGVVSGSDKVEGVDFTKWGTSLTNTGSTSNSNGNITAMINTNGISGAWIYGTDGKSPKIAICPKGSFSGCSVKTLYTHSEIVSGAKIILSKSGTVSYTYKINFSGTWTAGGTIIDDLRSDTTLAYPSSYDTRGFRLVIYYDINCNWHAAIDVNANFFDNPSQINYHYPST